MADNDNSSGNEWNWLWDKLTGGTSGSTNPGNVSSSTDPGSTPAVAAAANPMPAPAGGTSSGNTTGGLADVAGKIWNLPNTAMGTAYGILGYGAGLVNYGLGGQKQAPEISLGNNAIQFTHNPLNLSAVTLGNTINYGPQNPGNPSPESGYHTVAEHEKQHTYHGQILGPLFLPAAITSLGAALLLNHGNTHGPDSFMERGPQSDPPSPW